MILLSDNKILKNKKGKAFISHNIPFTPICESFIKYDPTDHSFSKTNGVPTSASHSEYHCDFRIKENLSGDFEISFKVMPRTFYVTLLIYNENNDEVRGFSSRPGMNINSVYSVNKVEKSWSDTYFKTTESKQIKVFIDETWGNAYWVLTRINGVVRLYINNELLSTETNKYDYNNLNVYGRLLSIPSKITNFSIKQL